MNTGGVNSGGTAESAAARPEDAAAGHDDAAARQAAEVAVEMSEARGPEDRKRAGKKLRAAAARAGASAARAASRARARGASGAGSDRSTGRRGVSGRRHWLTRQVHAMGPRLRVRDQATLRAKYPGHSDDEIARRLIERAARAAAAVGGMTGAWATLPSLPAFPAEVAAETLAVVGIEIKLIAELHEVYGMAASGTGTERARAYIGSWAARRGVHAVDGGLLAVAGSPIAKQLTRRLAARVRRSTFALAPMFTGAVAGALLNRRETRRLGHQIMDDLRQGRVTATATVVKQRRFGLPPRRRSALAGPR
jgi:hypothetical protein